MRARRVCRAWNAKLTSEEFCVDTIKLHFRSLWENSYASLDAGNQELAKTNPSKWLTGAAMDRIVRLHGQYHSMEVYWYNWDLDERFLTSPYRPSGPADPQYSTGKIAFRVDSRTLVVRSLSAELSQVFRDENREPIDKFLLSDEFLIGQKSNP